MTEDKKRPKFDMAGIATKIQGQFKKDPKMARKIGVGSDLRNATEADYIQMPQWWKEGTNTVGLPFGKMVTIAGRTDSGKSSVAIEAIKSALEQGCGVIYVETEGKTTTEDFVSWGVDPSQIILIKSTVAETAFFLMFEAWDAFKDKYPEANLLVVFDSIGGIISERDNDMDIMEDSSQPGGKGKLAKLGITRAIAKTETDNVALLMISYTYANMGSVGRTTAGGEALERGSCLMYQTSRMGWMEKTVKGEKQRVGAKVIWTLQKNHIDKRNPGPKKMILEITAEGIKYVKAEE